VQSTDARFKRFCHNDMSHLQQLIGDERGYLIASESIFSMDGDMAEVDALVRLAAQSDSWLMLDDAHGMGVLGDKGLGVAEHCNLTQDQLPVLMGTFGKAIGTAGAFIAGSEALIDYLINFSRHYIYSTAMPPAQATATLASLQHLVGGQARQQLADNIAYFKHLIKQSSWQLLPSASAIQPVLVGDEKRAVQLSQQLASLGIWATAIRSPTVPRGQARLRITLTSQHSRQDIAALVDALCLVEKDVA
jgi:8-amino-7-oxononanoate synthase